MNPVKLWCFWFLVIMGVFAWPLVFAQLRVGAP